MNKAFLEKRIFTVADNIIQIRKSNETEPDKAKMLKHAEKVITTNEDIYISLYGKLPPVLAAKRYSHNNIITSI